MPGASSGQNWYVDPKTGTTVVYLDQEYDDPYKVHIIGYGDPDKDNKKEQISYDLPVLAPASQEQRVENAVRDVLSSLEQVQDSINREFYDHFEQDTDQLEKEKAAALARLKKQLNFYSRDLGGKTTNPPDELYNALTEMIADSLQKSKVKYSESYEDMPQQIYGMLQDGEIKGTHYKTIDEVTYIINLSGLTFGGAGYSGMSVKWKDKNGREHSGYFSWATSMSEGQEALADYCAALGRINQNAWEEAASYLITGGKDAAKKIHNGWTLMEAICDPKKGRELAKEIGSSFAKEFGNKLLTFMGNPVKKFIEKLPNGGKLIQLAENGLRLKTKVTELTTSLNNIKKQATSYVDNLKQIQSLGNDQDVIIDTIGALKTQYDFATKELDNLEANFKKLDNLLGQVANVDRTSILDGVTYFDTPTGDEISANTASEKVENFRIVSEGKF